MAPNTTALPPAQRRVCLDDLTRGAAELGVAATATARATLIDYLVLLKDWNRRTNLTAVREPRAMVTRHLLDSLAVVDFIRGQRVADIGSGPGLPGLVLAIARPGLQVWLVEANGKKATFLRHVRRRLGLTNIEIVQQRAQAWRPGVGFENITCRALAATADCVRMASHLLADNGRFVLMKGRDPGAQTQALSADWRARTTPIVVPGLTGARHVTLVSRAV